MQTFLNYIALFDTVFSIVTIYYISSTVFYFLMWFFKRRISIFIEEHSLQFKLQVCYWCSSLFMFIYYACLLNDIPQRGTWFVFTVQYLSYIGYIVAVFYPLVTKLRSKIPDMRY